MDTIDVDTAAGPGRLTLSRPESGPAVRAVLLLGHGAGGGIGTPDLAALDGALPAHGIAVARYEQPWRVAGRRVAGPPASLDKAWIPALDAVRGAFPGVPLVVGGRSAGARVACRTLPADARGVLCLSFPRHPPGRPERSRIAELAAVQAPALVVQGARDPFGTPDELLAALAGTPQTGEREVATLDGAAHSVPAAIADAVAGPVLAWFDRLCPAPYS